MFWKPPESEGKVLSKPFQAAVAKLVDFISHHSVDLLFIQETVDTAALEFLVGQLNDASEAYRLDWVPLWAEIGMGFNRSNPSVRPPEYSAVIHKAESFTPAPRWRIERPLEMIDFPVLGLHAVFEENRDRFKRHPAHLTISFEGERLTFVTVHLASDSGTQSLRLDREIATLPLLLQHLRELTGADHVVALGDFNRNPDANAFTALIKAGHLPTLLPGPGIRTNTGQTPHVYDNFFVPRELWPRASAAIGADSWMRLGLEGDPNKPISDHYPILLALQPVGGAAAAAGGRSSGAAGGGARGLFP